MKLSAEKAYIYAIVILMYFNSSLMWKTWLNIPGYVFKVGLLLACVLYVVLYKKIKLPKRWIGIVCSVVLYFIIYIIGTRYQIFNCISDLVMPIICFVTFSCVMIHNNKLNIFMNAFVNVTYIIAAVSLFFWLFGSVLNILPGQQTIQYYWGGEVLNSKTYFYLYFENEMQNQRLFGMQIPRNCSIFTEVPAYSSFLLYALGVELFGCEEKSIRKRVVLVTTILSTQSTKAIIMIVILFIVVFWTKYRKSKERFTKMIKVAVSVLILIAVAYFIYVLMMDKSTGASFIVRLDDVNAAIKTWKENPIWGAGYGNDSAIINNTTKSWLRQNDALSMGFFVLLAEGGIVLTLLYLSAFWAGAISCKKRNKLSEYLLFSMIVVGDLFVSNLVFSMPVLMLVSTCFSALACVNNKRKKEFEICEKSNDSVWNTTGSN